VLASAWAGQPAAVKEARRGTVLATKVAPLLGTKEGLKGGPEVGRKSGPKVGQKTVQNLTYFRTAVPTFDRVFPGPEMGTRRRGAFRTHAVADCAVGAKCPQKTVPELSRKSSGILRQKWGPKPWKRSGKLAGKRPVKKAKTGQAKKRGADRFNYPKGNPIWVPEKGTFSVICASERTVPVGSLR
jgi:hypothetical protein